MNSNKIINIFDYTIYLFFIILLFFSLYSIDKTLTIKNLNGNKFNTIGKVISTKNNIYKKNSIMFNWHKTNSEDIITNNDEFFADQNSNAHLKLINGSEIFLNPGSIIRIDINNNYTNINIPNGELSLSTNENHSFKINNHITLKAKDRSLFNVSKSTQKTNIQLIEGEVALETNTQKVDLSKLTEFNINQKENIITNSNSLILSSAFKNNNIVLNFKNNNSEEITILLSKDISFQDYQVIKTRNSKISTNWNHEEVFIQLKLQNNSSTIKLSQKNNFTPNTSESLYQVLINQFKNYYYTLKKNSEFKEKHKNEKLKQH